MLRAARLVAPILAFLYPSLVAAQTCVGSPSFAVTTGSVGVAANFFEDGSGVGLSGTVGRRLFGTASFTRSDLDDSDVSLKTFAGGGGVELAPKGSTLRICPGATVQYDTGIEMAGVDFTTLTWAPFVSFGVEAPVASAVDVVPSASVAVLFQRLKADGGPLGEATGSETHGTITLGLSFIVNDVLSVGPSVSIPFADENTDYTFYGISASIGIRR
jgi:hypothetical protein